MSVCPLSLAKDDEILHGGAVGTGKRHGGAAVGLGGHFRDEGEGSTGKFAKTKSSGALKI